MLKKKLLFLFVFLSVLFSAQNSADAILGHWIDKDNSVVVQIYKQKNEYRAKIIWFNEKLGSRKPMHERKDTSNPNPELRERKIIGMEILEGLEYVPEKNTWEFGKIYDASSGRHWDSAARIDQKGFLHVRGFWKYKWIGRSMIFMRK